jgi:hypothetical protein
MQSGAATPSSGAWPWRMHEESVVDAARLGLAAGIANAQLPGAGELDPTVIDGILERITLTPI